MKNLLLLILLTFIPLFVCAQITFEKGYFIKNNYDRVECLIYNEDWRDNPTEIEYQTTEDGITKLITIDDITEFGIYNVSKYIRYKGKVDISSNNESRLTDEKEPIFEEQTIFLKVIVEGNANLYYYYGKQLERFFYQMKNQTIEPLIYKRYIVQIDGVIKSITNNKFRRQLLINMQCETMSMQDVDKLTYSKKALSNYFIKYHECLGEESFVFKRKEYAFHMGLKVGYTAQSFKYKDFLLSTWEISEFNPRFGIETEFTLPFNRNKWSVILSPVYQFMDGKGIATYTDALTNSSITREFDLKYQSIELQLGLRNYIFLNQNAKIFTNLFYVRDFAFNSRITDAASLKTEANLDIGSNLGFGLAYQYKKLALELRYNSPRDVISAIEHKIAYSNVGLSLRYDLF